ncbi:MULTISPECIES: GspH/FimT family pseudopilin [Pseudomonas]|uniref:Type II secretion system protein H n=1 Tax=Pseudomonas gingeri TaxID=117681 RepID=A0A7Y7WMU2_9PSED|nr:MULTISPECIES: GspH/FimT family pseudopilin [Pseudomonas]NWB84485.1 GspH/FimT family pseudopilin [Pseudomonas gingeri]RBH56986.1 prepilin-type N-terminal cleavage/methylation domain-containing protein [Pseudomonas sp. MWU13-2860]
MRRSTHGFTLVELMVTLAVFAILVAIALPSFTSSIQGSEADTEASDLVRGLNFARLEAMNRGVSVRVRPTTANAAWTTDLGVLQVSSDGANPQYIRIVPAMTSGATLVVTSGVTTLDFNNLGGLSVPGSAVVFTYTLGTQSRVINVCLNGRVSLGGGC